MAVYVHLINGIVVNKFAEKGTACCVFGLVVSNVVGLSSLCQFDTD